jgi:hypothetical protein
MVLVIDGNPRSLRDSAPPAWRRVQARAASYRLDQRLALGEAPEDSVLLALHAQRIVRPVACAALARTIRRVIDTADGRRVPRRHEIPVCVPSVLAAADGLRKLAERIEGCGPVGARGVARLRLLLSDGTGPLFLPQSAKQLPVALRAVSEAL